MKYINFGENSRKVSKIILGLMRISEMSVKETEHLILGALDNGINALDIADCYGAGKCEQILGRVFSSNPDLRGKVWLQSKCGIRYDEEFTYYDFSKEHILKAADDILTRLQTDHLDSLLLHRPDALMEPDEIAEAFEELHQKGKVLDFGVSNFNPMQMALLQKALPRKLVCDQVQLSAAFTPMLDAGFQTNMKWDGSAMRDGGILEYCRMNDMAVQSWSSLQYGFFEGSFLGSPKYPELNKVLDRLAEEKNVTPTAIALAWILRLPGKMQAVIGTTKADRVKQSAAACDIELTRKEWYEIYLAAGNKLP